jgi:hypothetical protein
MRTLDVVERKWGFAVGAVPLIAALVTLAAKTKVNAQEKLVHGHCIAPGKFVPIGTHGAKSCLEPVLLKPSVPGIVLLVVLGLVIMLAVWRSMRVLVAVTTIIAGLASGLLGIFAIFYGAWLLLRSWRLQRYGVTDGASVRKVVTERAAEKRETKKAPASVVASGAKPVTQSKRYTPKAKPRKQ